MIHERESLLTQNDIPSCRNGWAWMQLVEYSPYRVEQTIFPTENSGHKLVGPTPCTDGETLWVPVGSFDSQASFLFHEMAHAYLHYPNGKDPNLLDPMPRSESIWEFEACLTATKVIRELGLMDVYNSSYMRGWQGEYGDIRVEKVAAAGNYILALYLRKWKDEFETDRA